MLDFIGTVILVAATIVALNVFVSTLPVDRLRRLLLAVIVVWRSRCRRAANSRTREDASFR
jgi:hypothetical protein